MTLLDAVADLVRAAGLAVDQPVPLRSTNNQVLWMAPSLIVAKIARDFHAADHELQVARALAAHGAPVVPPLEVAATQPVGVEGRWVTFWPYVAQEGRVASAAQVASSLAALHAALRTVAGRFTFPGCQARLDQAAALLDQPGLRQVLDVADRQLLRRALAQGTGALAGVGGTPHLLHGSPHRFNVLMVDGEAAFIDFETVELGPLEWDLAHLEEDVTVHYPAAVDRGLLEACRLALSAATSTWCWEGVDRGPDMRAHAEHHLDEVRRALG